MHHCFTSTPMNHIDLLFSCGLDASPEQGYTSIKFAGAELDIQVVE